MEFVEARFQQEIANFRRLLRAQSQRLTRAGVHDLRVSIRRLRAQIVMIDKNSIYHPVDSLDKNLKRLGRALGERRQWDVALQEARQFHLAKDKLRKDQKRAGDKLLKFLRRPEVQELPQELSRFERPLKNANINVRPSHIKDLRSQLKSWLKYRSFSSQQLHELRISTKKIRYAMESLDLPVAELKQLQDHLGRSHDLTVLCEYFEDAKVVQKADRKERRRANKRIRPALLSSLEVLSQLR